MFRLVFLLLLGWIGFQIIKGLKTSKKPVRSPEHAADDAVQDPVCKKYLDKNEAVVGRLGQERYYFCSMDCLKKFQDQLEEHSK